MDISKSHTEDLRRAKAFLENPGLASRITTILGSPLARGFELLPPSWSESIQNAAKKSLFRALTLAVGTLDNEPNKPSSDLLHKVIVIASGAASGAFGLAALLVELPVSTAVMLRSIADVARSEGENIRDIESKLACMEVFALGGAPSGNGAAEAGYFAIRSGLARAVSDAAKYLAERGLAEEGAPALIRFIGMIATRFGVVVSEKAAAQAIPMIGAAGGALVNAAFIDHFQETARGHFIVRRLERIYGPEEVRRQYAVI